mmetsp:Transcript_34564/g.76797  ORF Transcript_34564/g.76797 Transcript_34564/m.76797 type:complete len:186 (+) Transcript_34564:213-770(+)|eukprot:CAMPEP_0202921122 /NCGR_PEP_ID=MMETSP1392-20130828/77227_1 /ASSEMBLY_ACC=CAM_ASM_000868 /TAXON_ID=225041 /ORGANISM="Chlamydomonas chlamydogama, Strain SAG 11-48b" /LENGTH=185 /DNA_ID=CAMNT_0049614669 /DNA_START=127 /DNA_END=684 /DNA_ORIENTATION=-
MDQPKNAFVIKTREKEDLNQYWYSPFTIKKIVEELQASATKAAFLSTPSVYFSLPKDSQLRADSWVFDLDEQWSSDPHYVRYDFNKPEELPAALHQSFDCVVIDPPFITREVWEKYAQAAKLLLAPNGKVIASTVAENEALLHELLGTTPCTFQPSIPHLIYQYNIFINFQAKVLCERNPELPED